MTKIPLLLTGVLLALITAGQEKGKWTIGMQLVPEVVFHKKNFARRDATNAKKASFSPGVCVTAQYNFTRRFFAEGGIGYMARRINGLAFFDHPGPTAENIGTMKNTYHTLTIPFTAGFRFWQNKSTGVHVAAGITGNFLLSSRYNLGTSPRYPEKYKRNYWQGKSYLLGLGAEHTISPKLSLTGRVSYSLTNEVNKDDYLFSQEEDIIALQHTYMDLQIGIRIIL